MRAKAAGIPPQPDRIMALHDGTRAALDDILVREGEEARFVVSRNRPGRCGDTVALWSFSRRTAIAVVWETRGGHPCVKQRYMLRRQTSGTQ